MTTSIDLDSLENGEATKKISPSERKCKLSGMVKIEAGEFRMGSSQGSNLPQETPSRKVYLPEYYIDKTPVTNKEYKDFLKENTNCYKPKFWNDPVFNKPDHPVVGVNWKEAVKYAEWAGKSLPTEAEWEKAAKGEPGFIYPWGNDFNSVLANTNLQRKGTTRVGGYPGGASPSGCLDMVGNVREWCLNWYDKNAYGRRDRKNPKAPPPNPEVGEKKALRGASWRDSNTFARSAFRFFESPTLRVDHIGFRCVFKE